MQVREPEGKGGRRSLSIFRHSSVRVTSLRDTLRRILWWGQLVTSPLWAQELSFKHLLEIARTRIDRQQASFLQNRVSGFCFPIVAMPSQLYSRPCHDPGI